MRIKRVLQASIDEIFAVYELAQELKVISAWLDGRARILNGLRRTCAREGSRTPDGWV